MSINVEVLQHETSKIPTNRPNPNENQNADVAKDPIDLPLLK